MRVTGERFIPGKMFKHSEVEHMHRYTGMQQVLADKVVLDAACGTGYGSNIIASVAKEVYGVDISQEAIDYANSNFGASKNLKYVKGDITKLPFENGKFDVVVSFETIEHIDGNMQIEFLKEIKRVLKPNGILIMSTPNKKIYAEQEGNITTEWHIKEFFEDEFKLFLKTEFKNVNYFQQYIGKASFLLDGKKTIVSMIGNDKEKKGKFILAVAGNGSMDNFPDINSIYYYPDKYAAINEVCQVYYADSTGKFMENNADIIEVSSKDKAINLSLEFEEEISTSKVRIDPLNNSCALKNFKVNVLPKDGIWQECITMQHNADKISEEILYFYHKDPQFIIQFDKEINIRKLSICFDIEAYDIDAYWLYMEKMKDYEGIIRGIEQIVGEKEQIIGEKEQIIREKIETMEYERNLFYNRRIVQRIKDVFKPPRRTE